MRVLHHRLPGDARTLILDAFPDVELVEIGRDEPPGPDIDAEILFTTARGGPWLDEILGRSVRWVHTFGTGIDGFPLETIRPGQILTCSRGASAVPIAEWCLAMMLAHAKDLPAVWLDAPPERMFAHPMHALEGATLGLVGLGGIGLAVARRALAFDMRVLAVRRRPVAPPLDGIEMAASVDELLPVADHLVIAAPATPDTRHLLDARTLTLVRPGLHVVNIARGSLIDQEALRAALDDGRVACASLDVTDPEPLPEGHWMYDHPQVRLSAHVSWNMPGANDRLIASFVDNLARWRAGEPLDGVVDVGEAY